MYSDAYMEANTPKYVWYSMELQKPCNGNVKEFFSLYAVIHFIILSCVFILTHEFPFLFQFLSLGCMWSMSLGGRATG